MSVQTIEHFGVTLYFNAFTAKDPPEVDLTTIANRPWTYQRPYTVLEVQHLYDAPEILKPAIKTAGYNQTIISSGKDLRENVLGIVNK